MPYVKIGTITKTYTNNPVISGLVGYFPFDSDNSFKDNINNITPTPAGSPALVTNQSPPNSIPSVLDLTSSNSTLRYARRFRI